MFELNKHLMQFELILIIQTQQSHGSLLHA